MRSIRIAAPCKAAIENAGQAFHSLGVDNPKVAVLAAVKTVNPKMNETMEADALKRMNLFEGGISGCAVEGPISYDLAMEPGAAEFKGYASPVAGDADILVVPDFVCGNLLAKSLTCTGGAKTGGVVLGAIVPIVFETKRKRKSKITLKKQRLYIILIAENVRRAARTGRRGRSR